MALTSVPCQALLLALMAVVLELAAASHFRGAIVQWRPVDPVNFDGRVSINPQRTGFVMPSEGVPKC